MSRADQITRVIRNLTSTTPDIQGAAVVDNDGLLIASALAQDVLGWRPAAGVERRLTETIDWYRDYFKGIESAMDA